jgi:mannose/fructose/N-acetylgalactosamine-specific phosphotransferase system component IIB
MAVALLRIDDRLVHGQVVEGWLRSLRATFVVVASDAVAADEMQMALYALAVPYGTRLSCLSIARAAKEWRDQLWEKERVLVLVSNPQDVLRLLEAGAPVRSVNVGGMHFKEGRIQVMKAVSVDESDLLTFRRLAEKRVVLEARPLPLDEPVDVGASLEQWQRERSAQGDQPR